VLGLKDKIRESIDGHWWLMPVILRMQRSRGLQFEASLGK
jgi:hypothetical protein